MVLTSVTALLAEAEAPNATPKPIGLGLLAGGILLVLIIIVTRFNRDR
jgi:hypothetical protein